MNVVTSIGGLEYRIDSTKAKKGADEIVRSFDKIKQAAGALDKSSAANFNQLAKSLAQFSSIKGPSATATRNFQALAKSLAQFKGPTAASVSNTTKLMASLNKMQVNAATSKNVAAALAALSGYKGPTARSVQNTTNLLRALSGTTINKGVTQAVRALSDLAKQASVAERSVASLQTRLSGLRGVAVNVAGNRGMGAVQNSFNRTQSSAVSLHGAVLRTSVAFQGLFAILGAREIVQASADMQQISAGLKAVFNTSLEAGNQLNFVRGVVEKFGIGLQDASRGYMQLIASAEGSLFTLQDVQSIFQNMSQASRVFGLSAADTAGIYKALTQIISKGSLQMEELRGQLGDRIPGAVKVMADALGITTDALVDMMKQGQVTGEMLRDGLVKFSAEYADRTAPGLTDAVKTMRAEFGRLSTAFTEASSALGEGGLNEAVSQITRGITSMLNYLQDTGTLTKTGQALSSIVSSLEFMGPLLKTVVDNIDMLVKALAAFAALKFIQWLVTVGKLLMSLTPAVRGLTLAFAGLYAAMEFLSQETFEDKIESLDKRLKLSQSLIADRRDILHQLAKAEGDSAEKLQGRLDLLDEGVEKERAYYQELLKSAAHRANALSKRIENKDRLGLSDDYVTRLQKKLDFTLQSITNIRESITAFNRAEILPDWPEYFEQIGEKAEEARDPVYTLLDELKEKTQESRDLLEAAMGANLHDEDVDQALREVEARYEAITALKKEDLEVTPERIRLLEEEILLNLELEASLDDFLDKLKEEKKLNEQKIKDQNKKIKAAYELFNATEIELEQAERRLKAATQGEKALESLNRQIEIENALIKEKNNLTPDELEAYEKKLKKIDELNVAIEEQNRLNGIAKDVIKETKTPTQQYNEQLKDLETLLKSNRINQEQFAKAVQKATDDYIDAQRELDPLLDKMLEFADEVEDAFDTLFTDIFSDGIDAFDDFFDSLVDGFKSLAAQIAKQFILGNVLGMGQGVNLSSLGSVLGAAGGSSSSGVIGQIISAITGGGSGGFSGSSLLNVGQSGISFIKDLLSISGGYSSGMSALGSQIALSNIGQALGWSVAVPASGIGLASAGGTAAAAAGGLSTLTAAGVAPGIASAITGPLAGSSAATLAANGIATGGSALTSAGVGAVGSLAASAVVMPFMGFLAMGIMQALMQKGADYPRSATGIENKDGRFALGGTVTENNGDPSISQDMANISNGILNGILDATSTGLKAGAQVYGNIGMVDKKFASRIEGGIFGSSWSTLGIDGLAADRNSFGPTKNGQRGAIIDMAARSMIKAIQDGAVAGLSEEAGNTLKIGLGNIARNMSFEGLTEEQFNQAVADIEFVAKFDELKDSLLGVGDAANDAAKRLEFAEISQQKFNASIDEVRRKAAEAAAEASPLKGIGEFVDTAVRLFDPTGGDLFQIRRALSVGGYMAGGAPLPANVNNPDRVAGEFSTENNTVRQYGPAFNLLGQENGNTNSYMLDVLGKTIDLRNYYQEGGDGGGGDNGGGGGAGFEGAFQGTDSNLIRYDLDKLAADLQEMGFAVAEADKVISEFFTPDERDRVAESLEIARAQVNDYFENLGQDLSGQITGQAQLFEQIVPAVSPIVEQMIAFEEQIKATRPELEALNEDFAQWGQEVIDIDEKINTALSEVKGSAQDQFLASLGIAVDSSGNVAEASVDFSAINSVAEVIKSLDTNADLLFKDDPMYDQVKAKIDDRLEEGLKAILLNAEDASVTMEQINKIFGDRLADIELTNIAANDNVSASDAVRLERGLMVARQIEIDKIEETIALRQKEADEIRALAEAAAQNVRNLEAAAKGFYTNSALTILSPGDRREEALKQLNDMVAIASGDPEDSATQDAIQRLPDLSKSFLEASRDYYGSSTDYLKDFNLVQEQLKAVALVQTNYEAEQLSKLSSIDKNIEDMSKNLGTLQARQESAYVESGGQYYGTGFNGSEEGFDYGYNYEQNKAIKQALNAAGYTVTGFGEGQLASLRGDPIANQIINAIDAQFATGGVMSSSGSMPLRRYASGGVANSPQIALFGEGTRPEAYVPLQDGRSIPVTLVGGMDSPRMISVMSSGFSLLDERLAKIEKILSRQLAVNERESSRKRAA